MVALKTALLFLSQSVLTLFVVILLLRLCLQLSRAHAYNAITKWILTITRPVIKPLKRFLPTWGRFDSALLLLLVLIDMIKIFIYGWIKIGVLLSPLAVLVFCCGELLQFTIHLYTIALIAQAILSWVNPQANALTDILYTLTTPLLNLARRFIPPIGGIDLSPIPVLLGLQLLNILIASPIVAFALRMM